MNIKQFGILSVLFFAQVGPARAFPVPAVPEKSAKDVTVLEQKLHGTWKGQGGCTGVFEFRADGTYEWRNYGPVGQTSGGKWEIRWDALPPTLILTCNKSDFEDDVKKVTEMRLTELGDSSFSVKFGTWEMNYLREKKK